MTRSHHLVFRLRDNSVFATDPRVRRTITRVVLGLGPRVGLLAFRVADTHFHVLAACDRRDAGRLAQAVGSSLQQRLHPGVAFGPAWIGAVAGLRHLERTFRYILRQDSRHGIGLDPYAEGSNLPDLLGLRVVGAYTREEVRRWLPRLRGRDLHKLLRLDLPHLGEEPIEPAHRPAIDALIPATRAATLLTDLRGRHPAATAARAGLVQAAGGGRTGELSWVLGAGRTSIKRLRRLPVDQALVRAILLQVSLRTPIAPVLLPPVPGNLRAAAPPRLSSLAVHPGS